MSQPDYTVSELPEEPLSEYAVRHGLSRAIARPPFFKYLRQLWERRHFIRTYARSKNISKYSNTALGQLWQVLTPLINAAIYFAVFGAILGAGRGMQNYPAYLIIGVFMFQYTQRSITAGAKSISGNMGLVRALHFPRASLPLANVLQELPQLGISMVVLFGIVLATGEQVTWWWLLIPAALILHTLFNTGASLVMARIGAFNRDINQLLPFVMRAWLYLSAVFWPAQRLRDALREHHISPWVADLSEANPGYVFLNIMRGLLTVETRVDPRMWVMAGIWAIVALVGGFIFFWRAEVRYGRG